MKVPVSSHIVQKMDKCTWNDSSRNQQRLTGVIFTFLPGYVTVSVLYWCLRLTSISMLDHRWDDWLFMVNNYRRCRAGNRSFVCACRLNVNVSICCRVKKGVKRRHIREYGWSHVLWSVVENLTQVVPKEIPQFWSVLFFALLHDRHFRDDWLSNPLKCLWFSAGLPKWLTFYFFTSLPKWRSGPESNY